MRDNNSVLPFAIVLLVLGGAAYLPRTPAPPANGLSTSSVRADGGTPTLARSEVQLVGAHFALDMDRLARRNAVTCARDLVRQANARTAASGHRVAVALPSELRQQLNVLFPAPDEASDVAPDRLTEVLTTAMDRELGDVDGAQCDGDAARVVRQFAFGDREALQLELLHKQVGPRADLRFLTAMVPDPVDSNGRWQFDPLVDALQRAIAESGYVLDRFALPDWDPTVDPERRATSTRHEVEPAVVLFRAAVPCGKNDQQCAGRERLLVLFLVYETATAGVHQIALQHALSTVLRWQQLESERLHNGEPLLVKILGPSYSGSIDSLQQVLTRVRDDASVHGGAALQIRIVSGSATSHMNKEKIETLKTSSRVEITYHATVLPDRAVVEPLLAYIADTQRPLVRRGPSALLVEGNTSFGQSILGLQIENVIQFPFPLHISRLRSIAARDRPAERPRSTLSRFLPLSLDDPITPVDQMPSLSPRSTAASVELVAANILSSIRRLGIASVGIFATDTRDKLFLAQQIQQFSPDVTVFTTEPDLLFTHPDYRRYTQGLVFGSTYPLFSGIQPSTVSGRRRVQFGSMPAQGVYNAGIALLNYLPDGCPLPAWDRAQEGNPPEMVDYSAPTAKGQRKPPLWIGVVGRDGVWPVRYERVADGDILQPYDRPPDKPNAALSGRPHLSPWLWALFVCVLALAAHHLHRLWSPVQDERGPRLFDFGRYARRRPIDAFDARSPYLCACLLSLLPFLALGAVLSAGAIAPDPSSRDQGWIRWIWTANLALWVAFAMGVLIAVCTLLPSVRSDVRRSTSWGLWMIGAMGCLLVLEAVSGTWFLADVSRSEKLRAFVERAGHPMNGVSPIGPVMLLSAGLYFWASTQLQRVSHQTKAQALVKLGEGYHSIAAGQLPAALKNVSDVIGCPVSKMNPRFRNAALIVAVGSAVLIIFRGWSTVEHWSFGVYFVIGLIITQAIIALWLAQLLDMWVRVREVLRILVSDALGSAFATMPVILFADGFAAVRFPGSFPGSRHLTRIAAEAELLNSGLGDITTTSPHNPQIEIPEAAVASAISVRQLTLKLSTSRADVEVLPVAVEVTRSSTQQADRPASWVEPVRDALHGMAAARVRSDTGRAASEKAWEQIVLHGGALRRALLQPCLRARLRGELGADRDKVDAWLRRAESLVVMPLAVVVRDFLARASQTLFLASGAVLLMATCLAMMPVQSRQTIVGLAWFDAFALSATALIILVQADRDELLSHMTNTPAGQVTWDAAFSSKVAIYVGLPLVTLFASQFPEVTDTVGRWIGIGRSPGL